VLHLMSQVLQVRKVTLARPELREMLAQRVRQGIQVRLELRGIQAPPVRQVRLAQRAQPALPGRRARRYLSKVKWLPSGIYPVVRRSMTHTSSWPMAIFMFGMVMTGLMSVPSSALLGIQALRVPQVLQVQRLPLPARPVLQVIQDLQAPLGIQELQEPQVLQAPQARQVQRLPLQVRQVRQVQRLPLLDPRVLPVLQAGWVAQAQQVRKVFKVRKVYRVYRA